MSPTIAITMGDPAGIGPEVIVKTFAQLDSAIDFKPFVIGDVAIMRDAVRQLGLDLEIIRIKRPDFENRLNAIPVLELSGMSREVFQMGKTSRWCGDISFHTVVKAVNLALSHQIDAVVTAPISKEAWHAAGHPFDGHTGLLAELTQCDEYRMTFVSSTLNVMLTTTHIPLRDVSPALSIDRIEQTIQLAHRFLRELGVITPRITVCGLNPHAGENGIFGNEDEMIIKPAVQKAVDSGLSASGPFPADTIFRRAIQGEFDLVIAQYHDQGLIPIKLIAFDTAVNISVGLPIIRTSVDHGTAFDIAGKSIADNKNMRAAIDYAVRLAKVRSKLGVE
ncbi:4-hydroxythreonine-4-phosphate dehydrogenase PdxA [bacterium]|nr:4-hydroxythreonine-4-phosphate dehydrogenase PdxA [bacterium]